MKNLVIVESPAKAKTIEKYLGKDYKVLSSIGHVRSIAKKTKGKAPPIDTENNFATIYEVDSEKKKTVAQLRKAVKEADTVWLATDEDREGEAIAWHLCETLKLDVATTKRIVFHEITKTAIEEAVKNPRTIDMKLVEAQQARQILDRIVGFELSPVVWRKVPGGKSAGRVQSPAVRLLVERERKIESFEGSFSFKVTAIFTSGDNEFSSELKQKFDTEKEANAFLESLINASFKITSVEINPGTRSPKPPFTTSTLQQEANAKLGFGSKTTMSSAQRLYQAGFITYMRTDSVFLSGQSRAAAKSYITSTYGANYSHGRNYKTKSSNAQEAHEAIRPTNITKESVTSDVYDQKLYSLIRNRTLASQMAAAKTERTVMSIHISTSDLEFLAKGEVIVFDGFMKVYGAGKKDPDILPSLEQGQSLDLYKAIARQTFARPPAKFSEGSLVKTLEELGIGRPSTYATIIDTVLARGYAIKGESEGEQRELISLKLQDSSVTKEVLTEKTGSDKGKLIPTATGKVISDFLTNHFEKIVDYNFTANVEIDFDKIADDKLDRNAMLADFYKPFHELIEKSDDIDRAAVAQTRELGADPATGKPVIVRFGRFGPMVQIGTKDDDEKPRFASLEGKQTIETISLEEAMELFKLPKTLGNYKEEEVIVSNGRFGPYVKFGTKYISLDKNEDPAKVDMKRAQELIDIKEKADAPIAQYEKMPVQKGVGRFGPFIKWNDIFINVSKKYDFDKLTQSDIEELIETKKKKNLEKIIHNWEEEGIRVEKARWGRFNIISGKTKIELPKTTNAKALTLAKVQDIIKKKSSKKK